MEEQEFLEYVAENVKWIIANKHPNDLSQEFKEKLGDLTQNQHKSLVFTAFMAWNLGDDFFKLSKESIRFFRSVFDEGYSLALFHESRKKEEEPLFKIVIPEEIQKDNTMQNEFSRHMIDASSKIISANKGLDQEKIQDLLNEYGEKAAKHFLNK